jgi:hypothetical protein
MIKLFRKIRQNLLNEGKTTKYFKYAIGEIVLVVIGILIALQINTWNENRNYRNQETIYLKRLLSENQQDIVTFTNTINSIKKGNESIVKFSEALKNDSVLDTDLLLTANNYFIFGSIYPVFTSSTSTFEDLSSTGNLQILTNVNLRDSIVKHYAKHQSAKEWLKVASEWTFPLDAPFTYENNIMKFEPTTAFLFPKEDMTVLAKELRAAKMKYISNAAAHYWINIDAINEINTLLDETAVLINHIQEEIKTQ